MIIDFRSDTVTKPTVGMLAAMQNANVGDDVFGEDPTINELENYAADLFGMESAIFCPSGTMTNQIAIKCHTQPGDEVICDFLSHVYQYEGGGIAFNAGCQVKTLQGNRGRINAAQVEAAINPDDIHKAPSRLVCVENTANRGGGSCYEWEDLVSLKELCSALNLAFHLDGARLFNALIAKKQTAAQYGSLFDSISVCLSKGLGAPVGSLLLGDKDFIKKARRIRKVWGGGMRQAGYIAAAGLYALENHMERLATDHAHAKILAKALQQQRYVKTIVPVETNILIFELTADITAPQWVATMQGKGLLAYAIAPDQVRLVTHLDISEEMIERTCELVTGVRF